MTTKEMVHIAQKQKAGDGVFYQAELRFFQQVMDRCRLQNLILTKADLTSQNLDLGLRQMLHKENGTDLLLREALNVLQSNTIYRGEDRFRCNYQMLFLPETEPEKILFIGPYLTEEVTQDFFLELTEKLGLAPGYVRHLENYYGALPVISSDNPLFIMLDNLGEVLWGRGNYTVAEFGNELFEADVPVFAAGEISRTEETLWYMQAMEKRYAHENALMEAVSQGLTHKVETLFRGLSKQAFEQRIKDPVRNLRNYCIIMNTLLRKAAENGGVHPFYLDRSSSEFARRIEQTGSAEAILALMGEMFRSYCRLVKKHSLAKYSLTIQKTITYIDADLAGDLSLSALAEMQNISAGYLSTLFKKETGVTLTDYVNQRRIKYARHLLRTTKLQVQTIAQHCGISDVNYFAKIFKKYAGQTPKAYRAAAKAE